MKKYFNTKEKAERHLEYRRQCAYYRIEKREDKILRDDSHIYRDAQNNKWKVMMLIWTEQMIKDAEKIHSMSYEKNNALIPFTEKELAEKMRIVKKMFLKKHKTNDIESDTINKDI